MRLWGLPDMIYSFWFQDARQNEIWWFPEIGGIPQSSILGIPHLWKPPYDKSNLRLQEQAEGASGRNLRRVRHAANSGPVAELLSDQDSLSRQYLGFAHFCNLQIFAEFVYQLICLLLSLHRHFEQSAGALHRHLNRLSNWARIAGRFWTMTMTEISLLTADLPPALLATGSSRWIDAHCGNDSGGQVIAEFQCYWLKTLNIHLRWIQCLVALIADSQEEERWLASIKAADVGAALTRRDVLQSNTEHIKAKPIKAHINESWTI